MSPRQTPFALFGFALYQRQRGKEKRQGGGGGGVREDVFQTWINYV